MCFICSISAVSASDVQTDDTNTTMLTTQTTETVDASNDFSSQSLPENDILGEDNGGAGSFSDLNELISSDTTGTITLDKNYTYNPDTDFDLANLGIQISTNKVIQGNGNKITIDGKGISKLFTLSGTITLRDITFINGYSMGTAAISQATGSNLNVYDCTFIENSGLNGGAIQSWGNLDLDGCTFINNTAVSGGAIQTASIPVYSASIKNSIFINNSATTHGGDIDSPSLILTIDNCNFTNSSTDGEGGAIYMGYMERPPMMLANVRIANVNINNAYANRNGAGIMVAGSGVIIDNINISDSIAEFGAGMYMRYIPKQASNLQFINNHANSDGGAIYYWGNTAAGVSPMTNVSFINNTADNNGGAVYLYGSNGEMQDVLFIGNNATNDGGAIFIKGSYWRVYNGTFNNNAAIDGRGGAIYLEDSIGATIDASTFTDNTAGNNGGAINWHLGARDGKVTNSIFTNNTAKRSGGAIHWSGYNGLISNSNFTGNKATGEVISEIGGVTGGGDGGAVLWVGSHGIIKDNCNFIKNTATYRGGAVFLHGNATENCINTTITHCNFEDNMAKLNGGAVDWQAAANDGVLSYSTFTNNTAWRSAGAVYWYGINGTINHCSFNDNHAWGNVTGKTFPVATYLTNGGNGGAIVWTGTLGKVTSSNFTSNTADVLGGAVYLQGNTTINCTNTTFDDCRFISNVAGVNGGAIDWHEGAHDGNILNSVFEDNIAGSNGGAVFWSGHDGEIRNSNFTNNTAQGALMDAHGNIGDGGAIIWSGINGTVDNCRFIENVAKFNDTYTSGGRGGAVFLQNCTHGNCENTTFTNCYFKDNVAGTNGGAIDWHAGAHNGLVSNGTFINNTASRSGGAIFWDGHNGTVFKSRFYDNHALGIVEALDVHGVPTIGGDGGAIMWSGALGTIERSNFVNNTAAKRGGAIFLQGSHNELSENTVFKHSYFANNVAGTNGGAIDWHKGARSGTVDNVTFVNNTAKRSGGAIFWDGRNGTVENSRFINNRATGEALQYDMDLTYEDIIVVNSNQLPTGAQQGKLYVLNYTNGDLRVFKSYTLDSDGNWVLLDETELDSTTISPMDWALDQFFGGDGGSILWDGDVGHIYNCTFTDSNSARRGGGAYMTGSDNVTYDNCKFIDCTSGTNGGGVDWLAGANYGKIYNCIFNGTRAARSAGAIYYDGWYGDLQNITIINTRSYGGTLKKSDDGLVNYAGWDSSHWDTNTTGGDAGAIMFTGNHEHIYNVTFINCTAQGRGGAVFLQDNDNVTFDTCKFIGNEALGIATNTWDDYKEPYDGSGYDYKLTGHGGAIAFDVNANDGNIFNSEFTDNYARRDGGAINFAEGAFNCTIENTTFTDNAAGDDGGAINWEGDNGLIRNITCYNNTGVAYNDAVTGASTSKGGTICLTGDNVTITGSKFELGTVFHNAGKLNETDAGALFITGKNTTISDSYFNRCYSPNNAGAIKVIGNYTTIDNCTFENCNATEDGGVLEISGQYCELNNSTFNNNFAGDDGGAISWKGGNGKIYNITCNNNRGISLGTATSNGGTLEITGSNITIEKVNVTSSYAKVAGGAIFVTGDHVNITDSSFDNCNVSHTIQNTGKEYANGGGAIYLFGNYGLIDNCTINDANGRKGGAIYIQGYDVIINGTTTTKTYVGQNGGSIYVKGIDAIISNSNIIDSNATVAGGAIYIEGANAKVINSTFNSTNAKTTSSFVTDNKGGALYIVGNYATIDGSNFTDASAYQGGILYLQGQYCNVINSSLDHGYSYHDGGAYYSTGTDSNVTGSNFTNNVARSDGGALFWLGSKYNYVTGCIFDNNTAYANPGHDTKGGGAIYFSQNGEYCGIKDSKFFNNSVQSTTKADGGAILWDKSSHIFIDGCLFDGNYVTSTDWQNPKTWIQGGVMYARPADNLTITNSVFQNCWSKKEAGALYLQNGGSIGIHLINNTFINNTAYSDRVTNDNDLGGGAILIKGTGNGVHTIINSTFINNTANFGGGIVLYQTSANVIITNATFDGNKAIIGGQSCGQGGSIWTKVKFTANNITFANGEATNRGGGLYISSNADMTYTNLTFINNSAGYGGGLYWSKNSVTIDGMTFINNSAEQGGAIFFPNGGSSTQNPTKVINSDFSGNSATSGGAIYLNNVGNIFILNNSFTDNSAVMDGGAIYVPFGGYLVDIGYSNFTGNNASQGGAIFSGGKGVTTGHIHDCNFNNNSATVSGGAIYVSNTQLIMNCNFDANKADGDGGAVYVSEGVTGAKIQDSTFTNSHASNGGAVYYGGITSNFNRDCLKIINDTFIKNIADYNGGAILYVTNNGINNYRDYNNFDGIGIPVDGGRTTVKTNGTNVEIISRSLFENNIDYKLLLRVISDRESPFIAVYLDAPRDWRANRLRFVVNLTNATTHEVISSVIVNASNYDTHYRDGMLYVSFSNLIMNETYNITASFEDLTHMYKVNSTTAQAHGEIIGEFKLLQRLIEDALERGDSEIILNRTFTFTPFYMGKHENMDDRCINLTHINRPFTIRGEGWLIDAAGYSRIFYITSPYVTIENVVLVGGNASGEYGDPLYHDGDIGGAIYWAGANGKLIDSHVENNTAGLGGAIYFNASAPDCQIINTVFEENTAVTHGGAIDCNASKMELYNNTFRDNSAYIGGALCREINSTNGRGVNNTFIDNNAEYAGAGIAWINATHISIDDYKFYNNHVGYSGGAIYVGEGSLNCEILNCIFANNAVDNETDGHGGAIEWYSEKGTVTNSVFINNSAYDGGAIYVGEGSGYINVTGSTFSENVALITGGAISIVASAVTINGSNFYDNIAKDGGAVYVGGEGTDNYVYSSVFEGNKAIGDENAMNGIGGAIDWFASSGTIVDTRFTDNCADYGGGVYFGGKSNASNIINCTFERNQAKYNGGAIDCNASMMYIEGTLFDGNVAQFGAALCRETNAKTGAGINNVFKNNHAIVAGAALGWMGSFGITITNYTFINNSADVAGGAIYASVDSHNCSVNDCTFEDNYVTEKTEGWYGGESFTWIAWDGTEMTYLTDYTPDPSKATTADVLPTLTIFYYNNTEQLDAVLGTGGAMTIFGANATITNSNFTGNRARIGGGVYIGASSGNADIDGAIWRNNVAKERGGAIDLRASAVNVTNSKFYDNIAVNGSALYVGGVGTNNNVYSSSFVGNNATGYGGAIFWKAYAGEIEDSNFTSNTAQYGGAIFLNGVSSNSNLTNVIFRYNNAAKNGGAIDCNSSNMALNNVLFEFNNAGEYGGALCRESNATNGTGSNNTFRSNHAGISGGGSAWMGVYGVQINDYKFIDNTADVNGGAIYIADGSDNSLINNSVFTGNAANELGGAIDIVADNIAIENSNFTDNHAANGGAIFVESDSGNTNITNDLFTGNGATQDGGAINLFASGVNINETEFYENTAGNNGGAVYIGGEGTSNTIHDSVFEDNDAGSHGGAIDWRASAGEIIDTNFTGNSAEYGGAIYLNGISTNSNISNIRFDSNTASKHGGAIDCNATEMALTNSVFTNNIANEYGGALCREEGATGGVGLNNTFIKNHADISGGAIAWLGVDNITIRNYTFENNTADFSGGAIFANSDSADCKVYDSVFTNDFITSTIGGRGGAIDWLGNNGTIENANFTNCVAPNGGAVYVGIESDNFTISNASFTLCKSLGDGGAILLHGDNVTIDTVNFTSNSAFGHGGALAGMDSVNANITNCNFNYNTASGYTDPSGTSYGDGGAVYWADSVNFRIADSNFTSNQAILSGGAISAVNCNDSVVSNIFTSHSKGFVEGGAISWTNSNNVTIEDSTFNDSYAGNNGGSIYFENVNSTVVKNSHVSDSQSGLGVGGAIYIDGNVTINSTAFARSGSNADNASALYFNSGNSTVYNSTFANDGNTIVVSKDAEVHLTENNITSTHPNKDIYYLEDNTDAGARKVDYSVWNDGTLYLDGNNFDYVIFNNGTIMTPTTTEILDNKTWNETWNNSYTFWAHIFDDNKNTIISVRSLDTYNNVYPDEHYIMPYNKIDFPNLYYQGSFLLYGLDNGLAQNTVLPGGLNVKMPVTITELTADTSIQGRVVINATLEPLVRSNYTIQDQTVRFIIGSHEYYANITVNEDRWTKAWAVLTLDNLTANNHFVTAVYDGDIVHLGAENQTEFAVTLRDTWLIISINNVLYGQNATVTVTTNSNSTPVLVNYAGKREKYLQLTKNGENYTATFNITDLGPGEYYASAIITSNDFYEHAINYTYFTVSKWNTSINATPDTPIKVGDVEDIAIQVLENNTKINASGFVKLTLSNGKKYLVELDENGTAHFDIYDLTNGTYTGTIEYFGDDYFNRSSTDVTFTVGPTDDYEMRVLADNITYGENATVTVILPSDATGNVTIYIDGVNRGTVNITDGIATLTDIAGLEAGQHEVNVTYNGNEKYASKDNNGTIFHVLPTDDWTIDIDIEAHEYGEDTIITVTLPENAKENVTLEIDGVNYTVKLTNGVGELTLNNLSAGLHEVNAYYPGDENYTNKTASDKFVIDQVTPTIIINATNAKVGENATINITVSGNATGNVTIYVDDQMFERTLTNHSVILNVTNLTSGNHKVVVVYEGNQNYTSNVNSTSLRIFKDSSDLVVVATPESVVVGKNTTITVTSVNVTSGNVIIEVNGINYTVALNNGVAVLNVTLPVGDYTAKAYFLGDDKYNASTNTSNAFHVVAKTVAWVNITAPTSVEIDNNLTFTVTTNSNATLVVKVNGVEITPVDGVYSFNGTVAGNYTITAEVAENDYYTQASNATEFTVYKHASEIESVAVTPNVVVGKNSTITVTMANNETGNVMIEVNGYNYTVALNNGVAVLNVTLPVGDYTAKVYYPGDDKYNATNAVSDVFHVVNKTVAWVNITAASVIEIDNNLTFTVTTNSNATLVVKVNGVEITPVAGVYSFNGTVAGNYTITAEVAENDYYTAATNSTVFTVIKHNSTVAIDVGAVYEIESDFNIIITNNTAAVVTINGKEYPVADGKVVIDTTELAAGHYIVTATITENDKYYANSTTKEFDIVKHNATIESVVVPGVDVVVGKNATITVTMGNVTTGSVIIEVGGHNYTVAITDKVAKLNVTLPVGDYTAKAYYLGDDKYNPVNATSAEFSVVNKTVAWVNITADKIIEIDNNLTFTVTTNSNATLVVKVNGVVVTPVNGVYSFNGTVAGNYTITAEVAENDYYTQASNSTMFTVIKHNSTVSITVGEVYEIESNFDIIITNNTAVVVTINGKEYPVVDGKVNVNTAELPAGHYIVTATIAENDKYYANSTTKEFDIIKHNATIDSVVVPGVDVVVGKNATITVTMGNVTTGSVIIEVGGHNYTVPIVDKVAQLNVTLPVGDYTAKAYFLGDDKYNPVNATSTEFSVVNKTVAWVNITADKIIEIDNNLTFTVTTNSNATLVVKVNGVEITPVNGVYSFNGTVAGNYTITAEVGENDYYTAATNSTVFTVIKHNSTVAIDVGAVYEIESDFNIIITNNTAAVVTINGKEYSVADGKVVIDTTELAAGHYIVTATIAENDKYYANSTTKEFDIIKHNATITSIEVPSVNVGVGKNATITVTMGNVTTGSIIIEVGGHNYTVAITDNVAVLNVTLPVGTYTANAYYLGDDKYNPANTTSEEFTVADKKMPTIIIDAPEVIEVDNNITFTVTNSTPVNVTVNGVTVELKDGKYTYNVTVAGTATIIARSAETDDYYEGFNSTVVTVIKHNSTVSIDEVPGHFVGDEFDITITNNTSVVVTINGKEYSVADGKVVVDTTALPAGEYTVTATVYENDKYYGNSSTVSFNIKKRASSVNITVGPQYYVGDIFNITIENNTAVNVTINGKSYLIDTNGNIIIDTSKLPAGEYIVSASVAENDKYFANATSKTFNIVKKASDMTVVAAPESVVVGKNTTITVTMANNETGSVIIEVNGVNYTVAIKDHVAQLNVALPAGDYTAKAYYTGDDYYNASNNASNVFHVVDKTVAWVNITADASIEIDNNITFTVTTNSNATLVVKVNGVEITPVDGVYSFNGTVAGNYTITAEVAENDYYTAASNSTAFTVYKHASEIESVVVTPVTAVDGHNTTITVTMANAETGSVLIEVNGLNYTVPIKDGVATLTVTLPVGDYTAKVYYPGDDKYNDTSAQSDAFHVVNKTVATVIITADSIIEIDNNLTFTVTTNSNATLVVKVNGVEITPVNGVYSFNGTVAGNYTITAEVAENDYYTAAANSTAFTVIKHNSTVAIDVGAVYEIESDFKITITNNTAAVVTINGKEYAVVDGMVNVNTAELPAGHYIVTATIAENDKYYANATTKEFDIIKHNATIDSVAVPDVDVVIGKNATITVTMGNVTSGSVIIEVGGHNYTVPIVDKVAQLNVTLPVGTYTAKAYFTGDDKYNPVNATSAEFNVVNKTTATVIITAENIIEIDNNLTFTVTTNSNSTLVVKVNGVEITPVDGVYSFNGTVAGNYTITAEVAENDYYTAASNSTMFTVIKHNSTVKVDEVPTHYVGDDFEITLTNNTAAVVTINGKEYPVVDGKVVIDTTKLPAGEYTVTATVYENDKYYGNSSTVSFNITKRASSVNVTADPINVNETAVIDITGPSDFNGTAIVNVDGMNYSVALTNGVGQLRINGLANGTYDINVTYLENDKYLQSVNDTVKLLVNKVADAEISASADNITVGDPAVIKVTVPEDATGNVTVTIGNITRTVPIAGGENEIIVPGVPVGDYDVKVTYNGDDKYLPANTTTPLSVKPAETDPADIKVVDQGNGTVVVVVPKDATGNVTITINGTNYTAPVVNGTATFDLTNETPETYDITATYSGDENYTSAATNGTVTIPKHPTPMSIEVNATVVGNVTKVIVSVPENVTGNVTVEIDGKTYSVKPVDGKAVFEIEGLTAGNKTVVASYAGDDSYLANSTTAQFKVDKVASSVNVTGDVIKVDETATIVIAGPSDYNGTAVVTIDGKDYSVNVTNGAGQLKVDGLANGTYDVKVTLLENDKYLSSSNDTAKVIVNKVEDAEVTASADDITVGDPAVIKVTVPEDATGNVTVTIGNITRTVPIKGGENEIIVPGVPVGDHEVKVTYNGDDKYLPANTTTSLTVKPIETSPDDIKVIDQGNGTVVVVVPANATGNVTLNVNGNNYTAPVVNGTATFDLTDVAPGTYDVTATYSGDENHTAQSTDGKVTIPKYSTPMSIEVGDGKVGETIEVTVNVPENATGKVTVEVNGKTYTKEIADGKAVFEVTGLLSGNKTVTATYDGDDSYLANSTTANFTVNKNPAPISVEVDNSTAGQATVTVTLPDDATGYVIVNVDGVDYGINLTEGDKSVTIPIKGSGEYTAVVTYLGDEKYLGNSTEKDFNASSSKVPPNIAAEVENVPVGEDVQVKVTIPEGGEGNVTVTVDNKTVTVHVTGGENIITIPGVSEGTHDVNISYSGNDQYEPQDITKSVTVFRSINAENITRGWNSPYDYKAEFLDKTGHVLENTEVQFIVNGKTYTVKTDSQGIAYLDTSKLPVGKYDVTIINPVTGEQVNRTTTIVKRLLENKDITMDFRDGTYYSVLAIGDDGKPVGEGEFVDIYVNTIHYSCRTDKDGYARLQLNLNPKTYTITAEYKLTKVSNKLVIKQTLKLVKKTVKVKKGKKLVLKAKLKWSNGKAIKGKKIVFKFKGKKYTAKTNSKGIAKVTIKKKVTKKLKKGKKYKYSATYVSNTVKGKVKVK